MKKTVFPVMAIIVISLFIFQTTALAALPETNSIQNNNTSYTLTSFDISSDGISEVYVRYSGYSGITIGASISITIKKNTFLWFYSTVVDDTYNVVGESYSHSYYYDLTSSGSGTYKCFVTYTVSGSGGADDVIPFEDTASF